MKDATRRREGRRGRFFDKPFQCLSLSGFSTFAATTWMMIVLLPLCRNDSQTVIVEALLLVNPQQKIGRSRGSTGSTGSSRGFGGSCFGGICATNLVPGPLGLILPPLQQQQKRRGLTELKAAADAADGDNGDSDNDGDLFYNDFEDFESSLSSSQSNRDDNDAEDYTTEIGEEGDNDDDAYYLDVNSLGDWREFRRNLAMSSAAAPSSKASAIEEVQDQSPSTSSTTITTTATTTDTNSSSSSPSVATTRIAMTSRSENGALLQSQCEELAHEYNTGVWAHATPTPEVGGLVLRMPLEVELFHNHKRSITGKRLREQYLLQRQEQQQEQHDDDASNHDNDAKLSSSSSISSSPTDERWYKYAQHFLEREMIGIAERAGDDGQIDTSTLTNEQAELLQLYLDHQESWQEVCLVLKRNELTKSSTTLVLNRPMALKLTENLAQLVLYGALPNDKKNNKTPAPHKTDLIKFLLAFGPECAVYIGGPDDQDQPAELLHGISDLDGAVEISPGSNIYCGGLDAAVRGVLRGEYKPMDFRFFVGRHNYDKSDSLELSVLLGKHQPIACARSLVLKQCISLPQPLWHEVLDLCGGEMKAISQLEQSKREDVRFQIIDEDDDDGDEDHDEIVDELSELDRIEDEDEDDEID